MTSPDDKQFRVQNESGAESGPRPRIRTGKIFISYCHVDSAGHTGHIHEKLASHFGRDRIFRDVDNLPAGIRFDQHIQELLNSCSVMLAVIGRYWLTPCGEGQNRLEPPRGWVRTEIATALRLGVPVIPVLVHGATMPKPEDLSDELANLVYWQAVEIRDKNFQHDVEQLIRAVTEIISATRIDRYKIGRRLGGGRSGEVFYAEDTLGMGRTVALKKLHPHVIQDERVRRDFERYARAVCDLDNPNILRTYDIGKTQDSCPFIVTEYFQGETLRRRMSAGPVRLLDAVRIARRVAEALSAAHKAGVIHGDIRPENIMVNADNRVKVFDFGLAGLTDQLPPGSPLALAESPDATRLEARINNYRSPERLRGEPGDERADIWGLGIMLHEMVAERLPFDGPNAAEVCAAILSGRELSPSFHTGEGE
ncbi:MAG TPA: protein kinase, partial [Pyrinomonadaceae bacterium]